MTITTGLISSSFWYGIDPNRTGFLVVEDAFGVPAGSPACLLAMLDEVGWRLASTGPIYLSASVSRLHWAARDLCGGGTPSELTTTQIGLGGGLRLGPGWLAAEYGIRWSRGTADFTDIDAAPQQSLLFSIGLDAQMNPISSSAVRYPVEHYLPVFSETFPLGCTTWDWEGQAGYLRAIDEQLGIVVSQADERIIREFGVDVERYVMDLEVVPRSVANPEHFFGVIIRYEDTGNYYSVEIRTDGHVRLSRVEDGDYKAVTPWTRTRALHYGVANDLRVVVPGNRVIAYLNGVKILDSEEVSFTRGRFGVFARTQDEAGAWVTFDNIAVREIESGIVLDPRNAQARGQETLERVAAALLSGVAALVSYDSGLLPVTYAFVGIGLHELFYPSRHLLDVR
ncbi:hypothetical protein ACFLR0_01800 [Candidatus Bipolaricaulota bacterium]